MRTGSTVIIQRDNFVIANGCSPLENLIRRSFANELLAGEPENFTYVSISFGAERNCLFRSEQNFLAVWR
jgi:hypothetical protein